MIARLYLHDLQQQLLSITDYMRPKTDLPPLSAFPPRPPRFPPPLAHLITIREPSSPAGAEVSVSVSSLPLKSSRMTLCNPVLVSFDAMGCVQKIGSNEIYQTILKIEHSRCRSTDIRKDFTVIFPHAWATTPTTPSSSATTTTTATSPVTSPFASALNWLLSGRFHR